ncbi:AraC family transcriptional regulator ligand-binding domain-containing protein [Breoghania sp. JC706]|uniref:helix-turn-helix domain-containing protein n=1 Tax=Breoghania sp. JC706 TaxID=3117732 RepID=UPI00300936D6
MTIDAARKASLLGDEEARKLSFGLRRSERFGNEHVAEAALLDLWKRLEQRYGGPEVGALVALNADFSKLGLLGDVISQATSAEEIYARIVRFNRLLNQNTTLELKATPSRILLFYHHPRVTTAHNAALHAGTICSLGLLALVPRRFFDAPLAPEAAYFACPPTAGLEALHDIFGPTLHFSAETSHIEFNRVALRRLHRAGQPHILGYLERLAEADLEQLPARGTLAAQTRQFIGQSLAGGAPSHAAAARSMGMSVRTFQRSLSREGATYSRLLQETRRELAERLLESGRYSLSQITYLLGYSEQAAFSHAARRWFKKAPRAMKADPRG